MGSVLTRNVKFIGLVCSVASQSSIGLSLGTVQYRSFLDEPLDAYIDILDVAGAGNVLVVPANEKELARLGVKRRFDLETLHTRVMRLPSGKLVVRITTTNAVTAPQLSLALRAQWQDEAIVQKYTLLLEDPPEIVVVVENDRIFEEAQGDMEMLEAETTEYTHFKPVRSGKTADRTAPHARSHDKVWNVDSDSSGRKEWRVSEGQKLNDIALRLRPASTVGVDQMMVAIANKNSSVLGSDLGRPLKPGQILAVPSKEEILKIDRQQAKRSVLLSTLNRVTDNNNERKNSNKGGDQPTEKITQTESQSGFLRLGTAPVSELPGDTKTRGRKVQGKNFKGSRSDLGRRLDNVLARLEDANLIIGEHRTEIDGLNVTIADLNHAIELKNTELAKLLSTVNAETQAEVKQSSSAVPEAIASSGANTVAPNDLDRSRRNSESLSKEVLDSNSQGNESTSIAEQKAGVVAAIASFIALIFGFLTFARWRHARLQKAEYDPLNEELKQLEQASANSERNESLNAVEKVETRHGQTPSKQNSGLNAKTLTLNNSEKHGSAISNTTNAQKKTKRVQANGADNVDSALAAQAIEESTEKPKQASGESAEVVSISVKAIPVNPMPATGKKLSAVLSGTHTKGANGKESGKQPLIVSNKELIDEVANEFDEQAPMPWSPPKSGNSKPASDSGEFGDYDTDVAVLSKPTVSGKSKSSKAVNSKPNTMIKAQQQVSNEKSAALVKNAAVEEVSDIDSLIADDFGFGVELEATPLETARAYIELDDVQAALKILTDILADDNSAEHEGAGELLASINT